MKSPFLDEELLSAEPRPDFDTAVERVAKESPFLEGFAEASLNRASSEDQYYVNEFPPEDAQESLKSDDEESGDVEYDLPTDASPFNALASSELKAVRITSTFETGRAGSFGGLTGNFDGQGVSFGLMNFAWKAGSLVTLLKEFLRYHPAGFADVFGPDAPRFQEIVSATRPDPENPRRQVRDLDRQMEFARNILNDANNKIREPWRRYFARLEVNPDFKRIQVKAVRRAAERARVLVPLLQPENRARVCLHVRPRLVARKRLAQRRQVQGKAPSAAACHAREEKGRGRAYHAQRDREA